MKDARHALQMGRPEEAEARLSAAARQLSSAETPYSSPSNAPEQGDEGLRVLNMHGHRLGEIESLVADPNGPVARIGHGGFWNIGETITELPAEALLYGQDFAVLPSPVSSEEFGEAQLRRQE